MKNIARISLKVLISILIWFILFLIVPEPTATLCACPSCPEGLLCDCFCYFMFGQRIDSEIFSATFISIAVMVIKALIIPGIAIYLFNRYALRTKKE